MTISAVSGQFITNASASATSIADAPPVNVTVGNVILLAVAAHAQVGGTPPDDFTVSDNLGNTWTQIQNDFVSGEFRAAHYRCNITTGGAMTVTFSHASSARRMYLFGFEFVMAGGSSFDQTNSNNGSGTAVDSGNITTTVADEVMLGSNTDSFNGSPYTEGSGWIEMGDSTTARGMAGYRIVSSTGVYSHDATAANSVTWLNLITSYSEVGGAPPSGLFKLVGEGGLAGQGSQIVGPGGVA